LYGPQELPAFMEQFSNLAKSIALNTTLPAGLPPPTYNFTVRISLSLSLSHSINGSMDLDWLIV